MGFFDSLTGSSQRRDMRDGAAAYDASLGRAKGHVTNYGNQAKNNYLTRLQPYQDRSDNAYGTYSNALGLNGNEEQQGYWDGYQNDPQRGYDEDRAVSAVNRGMSARGMSQSGLNALAGNRAAMDVGRSYTNDRLNRLQGLSGEGSQIAGHLASGLSNIDLGMGNALAGYETQQGQNQQALHQGLGSTRSMGWDNALKVGGMAISAATGMPMNMGGGGSSSPAPNTGWGATVYPRYPG